MDERDARPRARAIVWVEWGAVVLLLVGVAAYVIWKPLDPMADPRAAQALALVQTHPARSTPTIRQAIDAIVKASGRTSGTGIWCGSWCGCLVTRSTAGLSGTICGGCGFPPRP